MAGTPQAWQAKCSCGHQLKACSLQSLHGVHVTPSTTQVQIQRHAHACWLVWGALSFCCHCCCTLLLMLCGSLTSTKAGKEGHLSTQPLDIKHPVGTPSPPATSFAAFQCVQPMPPRLAHSRCTCVIIHMNS